MPCPFCFPSRLFTFQLVAWRCVTVRGAPDRYFAASMMALAFAIVTTSPEWAQDKANPPSGKSYTASPDPSASKQKVNATVKTAVRSRIGSAWSCDVPDQLPPLFGRADHGRVEISRGKGPQCDRESMALAEIFYTSEQWPLPSPLIATQSAFASQPSHRPPA